jgi:hypothetical protein
MDLKKIGLEIKAMRGQKTQVVFLDELNEQLTETYSMRIDGSRLSRIENGLDPNMEVCEKICAVLGIKYLDDRLRIAFSQGFWAAPIITINEGLAPDYVFERISLTSYTDKAINDIIFSEKNKRLPHFISEKHAFFYSGEVIDMLHNDKIDIGFLGSTVVEDEKDLVRIARVNDAGAMRHAMIVVVPKGKFKSTKEAITHLLTKHKPSAKAHVYYHPRSTAAREFRSLLQHAEHYHNTLDVLDLEKFKDDFKAKLIEHKGKAIAHLGLMLSVGSAKNAAEELDKKNEIYDIFTFRTSDIVSNAQELGIKDIEITPFFYEMVVRRSNDKIKRLAKDNKGFQDLLKYLRLSVTKLSDVRTDKGIPLEHNQVANFFGLDVQEVSFMLKKMEFELVYYPEWVNKVLSIV